MEYEEALANFASSELMAVGETFFMGRNSEKGPFMVVVEMLLRSETHTNKYGIPPFGTKEANDDNLP